MPKTQICESSFSDGARLYYINDGKYKTNYLNIYFSLPLTAENSTKAALTARLLKRGSEKYPTMAELNSALDMSYAATVGISSYKEGEKTVFTLNLATMKNEYAPEGEDIFADSLEVAFDMLFHPLTENGCFAEEYFESEKRNLRDSIQAQINNKSAYSRTRFIKTMCEGEPYSVNGEGDLDVLDRLTSAELYGFWHEMVSTAVCNVYFVGSESEEKVKKLLSTAFSGGKRASREGLKTSLVTDAKERDVTERLDIAQAHLWIGYRTGITYSSPDYLKFVLFNMVLGGDVSSKMFMNIREKLSLCYTCYSMLDGAKGIFAAYAGIDPENREKTLNAFFEELENVRAGRIGEDELEDAKKAYINRMKEIQDNPSLLPSWFHIRLDSEIPRDPSTDAEEIARLTVDDVVWAAKQIKQDTVYFLTKTDKEA